MTTAIISFTDDPKYDFFIPIVKWGWEKIGVSCHFLVPARIRNSLRFQFIESYCNFSCFSSFTCPLDKEVTYAQVGRLFMGNMYDDEDILITSDADMLVFKMPPHYGRITVFGGDLVPDKQFPMCYASGTASNWKIYFGYISYQEELDKLIGPIECENIRGNYWGLDQETLYNHTGENAIRVNRAKSGTQFASNRVDRDDSNWRSYIGPDLIDAHLWRPGYTDENFANIIELLQTQYPNENFDWLIAYRTEYLKLI